MYNRYIPQDDGTFRKNHMPDPKPPHREPEATVARPAPPPCEPPTQTPTCRKEMGAGAFLRGLLPKGLDTGDLLIILLLLLMAGDCAEDKNTALLTLALYLFM